MKIKMWVVQCPDCEEYIYINRGSTSHGENLCKCGKHYWVKYQQLVKDYKSKINDRIKWTRLKFCRRKHIWIDEKIWKLTCRKCKEPYIIKMFIYEHEIGDNECKHCWRDFPCSCQCGGLIHCEYDDEDYDGNISFHYKCDQCHDKYKFME